MVEVELENTQLKTPFYKNKVFSAMVPLAFCAEPKGKLLLTLTCTLKSFHIYKCRVRRPVHT